MTSQLLVAALVAIIGTLSFPHASSAGDGCEVMDVGPSGCITLTQSSVEIVEEDLTIYTMPAQGTYEEPEDTLWLAQFTPYCGKNLSGTTIIENVDSMCQQAELTCANLGSDAPAAMYMVITPLVEAGQPQIRSPLCFGNALAGVQLGPQIQALVESEIGAAPPPVTFQPSDAIVNLPMITFTTPRGPIAIDVDGPIAGTAEATPEYLWTFAEGAAAHGPGFPYDGTSPTENPGYYVAYTYHELGTPTVSLTVTWRVTFTIPGNPPVPLDDVIREATATTTVRAAGSELVGG